MNHQLYEIHLTLDLATLDDAKRVAVEAIARGAHWKTSEIARDPLLGQATYFYLTTHDRSALAALDRIRVMKGLLGAVGIESLRDKIEHIIFDTKLGLNTIEPR